jgi:hypothetical protein
MSIDIFLRLIIALLIVVIIITTITLTIYELYKYYNYEIIYPPGLTEEERNAWKNLSRKQHKEYETFADDPEAVQQFLIQFRAALRKQDGYFIPEDFTDKEIEAWKKNTTLQDQYKEALDNNDITEMAYIVRLFRAGLKAANNDSTIVPPDLTPIETEVWSNFKKWFPKWGDQYEKHRYGERYLLYFRNGKTDEMNDVVKDFKNHITWMAFAIDDIKGYEYPNEWLITDQELKNWFSGKPNNEIFLNWKRLIELKDLDSMLRFLVPLKVN